MSKFIVLGKLRPSEIISGTKVVIGNDDWSRKLITVAVIKEILDVDSISYESGNETKTAKITDLYKLYLVDNALTITNKTQKVLIGDGTQYSYEVVNATDMAAKLAANFANTDVLIYVGDIDPSQYELIIKYNIDSTVNSIDSRFVDSYIAYDTETRGFGSYYPSANSPTAKFYILKEELFILRDICLNNPNTSPQFGEYMLTTLMDKGYKLIKKQ